MKNKSFLFYDPLFDELYEYSNQGWVEGWMLVGQLCAMRAIEMPDRFVLIGEL